MRDRGKIDQWLFLFLRFEERDRKPSNEGIRYAGDTVVNDESQICIDKINASRLTYIAFIAVSKVCELPSSANQL